MAPAVSVCIPVYNGEPYIREAIRSVLAQTFEDFELVVVDNCSKDGTADAVREFTDPRIRLVQPEAFVDAIDNWNRAIAHCEGRYLKVVCHDDAIAPRCLELQVAALEAHPEATMAAAQRDVVDDAGHVLFEARGLAGMDGYVDGREAIAKSVRFGTNAFGEPASVLLRHDTVREVGPFSHDIPYLVDLEMYFRVLDRGGLVAMPGALALFRTHGGSWSAKVNAEQGRQMRELFSRWARRPGSKVRRSDLVVGGIRAEILRYVRWFVLTDAYRRLRAGRERRPPTWAGQPG